MNSYEQREWKTFFKRIKKAIEMYEESVAKRLQQQSQQQQSQQQQSQQQPPPLNPSIRQEWKDLHNIVAKFDLQKDQISQNFAFSFIEGPIIKAIQNGYWLLLDEINLASPETLEVSFCDFKQRLTRKKKKNRVLVVCWKVGRFALAREEI